MLIKLLRLKGYAMNKKLKKWLRLTLLKQHLAGVNEEEVLSKNINVGNKKRNDGKLIRIKKTFEYVKDA